MYKSQSNSLFIGKNLIYLPSCQSTNDELAVLVQSHPLSEGTIVITDNQTAGRGQRGSGWQSTAHQNLTFSLLLKPIFVSPARLFDLTIALALGVYETLKNHIPNGLTLKWPNDIYVNNQKMGGMLIETSLQGQRLDHAVVGIGLNVNQTDFEGLFATSLRNATGQQWVLSDLLNQLCETIEVNYLQLKNGHAAAQRARYLQCLYGYQETKLFEAEGVLFEGLILGVSESGTLAVQVNDQLRYFDLKEIKLVLN